MSVMSRSLFAVFHPAATDDKGQALNINADTAAGEVRGLTYQGQEGGAGAVGANRKRVWCAVD